jgi:hypothetical protein
MSISVDQSSSLRLAATSDKRPARLKDRIPALYRADVYEFVIFVGVCVEKDLPRDLTAHNPRTSMDHSIGVQRSAQAGSPTGIIDAVAVKPAQVHYAKSEAQHQISQDATALQILQDVSQPGRIWRRYIQNIDGQYLARIRIFYKGYMLIRALEDHGVDFSVFAYLARQIYQKGAIASIQLLRIKRYF